MKPHISFRASLALLLLAGSALAAPEQWLKYHLSQEGRAYRWVDLTNKAPVGVALPKLDGTAYFARWKTPMDPSGGRWMCFDRTRKAGPWNRIYFDSNGNGRLDDETPHVSKRTDTYSAYFEPVRVVFKGEDGPTTYHLLFRFMKYDENDVRLLTQSGGWYEGSVELAGKRREVKLIDNNVNGVFNDRSLTPDDADRIEIGNTESGSRYLGRLIEVDDQMLEIEVAKDGAFIKTTPAKDLQFGEVKVPEGITSFAAVGEVGHFIRKPGKGAIKLPVGAYRLYEWSQDRKDDKGVEWGLAGSDFGEAANFTVAADKSAALKIGEPVRVSVDAAESRSEVRFSLKVQGALGETVDITRNGQRPVAPKLVIASADGSYSKTNSFEYG